MTNVPPLQKQTTKPRGLGLETLWAMASEGFVDSHLTSLFLGCGEAGHHGKANYLTVCQPGYRRERTEDSRRLSTVESIPSNQTYFSVIPSYYEAIRILIHW